MQRQLDAQLDSVTQLGVAITSPLLKLLIDRDFGRDNPEVSFAEAIVEQTYDPTLATWTQHADPPAYAWALSAVARNAAQHSINGNGSVSTAQFAAMVVKTVAGIKGTLAGAPQGVAEAVADVATHEAWNQWIQVNAPPDHPEHKAHIEKTVIVQFCNQTTTTTYDQADNVATVAFRAHAIPLTVLTRLDAY